MTDATEVPCSPPSGAGSCALSGDGVCPARELGVREVEARVDDRDGHARPGCGLALDADLGEPPLVGLERIGRLCRRGDRVGLLPLCERQSAAVAKTRKQ